MPPAPKPPSPAEVAHTESQGLLQLWVKIRAFLLKAETQDPITREEEQGFLETKSELSRAVRSILSKLPAGVTIAADRLQDILRQSIAIGHLRGMPKADKSALITNWHYVFIHLSRAVGAFQMIAEGYVPPARQAKQGTGVRDMKGAAANAPPEKKKSFLKSKGLWALILIGIAGAAWYFTQQGH